MYSHQVKVKLRGHSAKAMTIKEMQDFLAVRRQLDKKYMDYPTFKTYDTEAYARPTRNKETKRKATIQEPKKPSAKADIEAVKYRIQRMREQGYPLSDIHELLDLVYSDYKETFEEIKKNAPKCPFEIGDILKTENSKHDFRYFEIKKLNFDPVNGWMADVNFITSKEGVNVSASSTTLRKMAKGGRNSYNGLILKEQKFSKVTPDEMPKLFSRHPYTNIFY